jgi:hypothetical protein
VSRYDYIYIHKSHFQNLTEDEMDDINGLEFQTKDLQREFLQYDVPVDGVLCYQDFHYELVDNKEDGLFTKSMRRVYDGVVRESFTGEIIFYGKPYESMYIFLARFTDGRLDYIRLLNKSLPIENLDTKA